MLTCSTFGHVNIIGIVSKKLFVFQVKFENYVDKKASELAALMVFAARMC